MKYRYLILDSEWHCYRGTNSLETALEWVDAKPHKGAVVDAETGHHLMPHRVRAPVDNLDEASA